MRPRCDVTSWTGRGPSGIEGGARLPTRMRKLGVIVTALMAMTMMLSACTSSTVAPPKPSSSTMDSPARLVTAPTTVTRADLSRFVALAHRGLREPFEAAYRFDPPLDTPTGQIDSFRIWSEPVVGSDPEGNFVYEAPFGRGTFLLDFRTEGPGVFERFRLSREETLWYYGELAKVNSRRKPGVLADELRRVVTDLRREAATIQPSHPNLERFVSKPGAGHPPGSGSPGSASR